MDILANNPRHEQLSTLHINSYAVKLGIVCTQDACLDTLKVINKPPNWKPRFNRHSPAILRDTEYAINKDWC